MEATLRTNMKGKLTKYLIHVLLYIFRPSMQITTQLAVFGAFVVRPVIKSKIIDRLELVTYHMSSH